MSPFAVELSEHARKRIKERGITRAQIRTCLAKGALGGVDLGGRRIRRLKVGKKVLEVIYLETSGGYLIVTAYWRNIWP